MIEYYVDPGHGYAALAFENLDDAIEYARQTDAPQIDVTDATTGDVFACLYQSENWGREDA